MTFGFRIGARDGGRTQQGFSLAGFFGAAAPKHAAAIITTKISLLIFSLASPYVAYSGILY